MIDQMIGVRVTPGVLTVLELFLDDLTRQHYGYQIMDATDFSSGKTYQILARLTAAGWLERHDGVPSDNGGPPRVAYSIPTCAVPTVTHAAADAAARRARGTTRRVHSPRLST